MNDQNPDVKSFGEGRGILFVIALFVLLLLGFIYFFVERTKPNMDAQESSAAVEGTLQKSEVDRLKEENEGLRQHIARLEEGSEKVILPIISYGREGLLSQEQKTELTRFLINPFIDYHSDNENELVSIFITPITDTGAKYKYNVTAIFERGYQGFLYGTTNENLDWWLPTCMGACDLTEEFRILYPSIAEQVQ